jgi:hypothetical protein
VIARFNNAWKSSPVNSRGGSRWFVGRLRFGYQKTGHLVEKSITEVSGGISVFRK